MSTWNLRNTDESDLYDHLRSVIKRTLAENQSRNESACTRHGWSMSDFHFDDGDGRINLLGARGFKRDTLQPCTSSSLAWDDTMFVIFKENDRKRVKSYHLNTEQNSIDPNTDPQGGLSFLMEGTHRYRLGHHGSSRQRALEPDDVVETLWDKNQNFKDDEGTGSQWIGTINIHYGGDGTSPEGWSAGCQTIKNQADYDAFRECVETDISIKGSINNEFARRPSVDGDRVVIYTLVKGEALAPNSDQPASDAEPISQEPVSDIVPPPPGGKPNGRRGSRGGGKPKGAPKHRDPNTRPVLQIGSQGDDVSALQRRLSRFGFDAGTVDGIFGSDTERAVRGFQSAKKLPADGIVGAKTWAALSQGRRRRAS